MFSVVTITVVYYYRKSPLVHQLATLRKKISTDAVHNFFKYPYLCPFRQTYVHVVKTSCLLTRLKGKGMYFEISCTHILQPAGMWNSRRQYCILKLKLNLFKLTIMWPNILYHTAISNYGNWSILRKVISHLLVCRKMSVQGICPVMYHNFVYWTGGGGKIILLLTHLHKWGECNSLPSASVSLLINNENLYLIAWRMEEYKWSSLDFPAPTQVFGCRQHSKFMIFLIPCQSLLYSKIIFMTNRFFSSIFFRISLNLWRRPLSKITKSTTRQLKLYRYYCEKWVTLELNNV